MATATVIASWSYGAQAHIAIRVADVEFVGSVPVEELSGKTAAQKKSILVAAAKAVRDAQLEAAADLGITGTATV